MTALIMMQHVNVCEKISISRGPCSSCGFAHCDVCTSFLPHIPPRLHQGAKTSLGAFPPTNNECEILIVLAKLWDYAFRGET